MINVLHDLACGLLAAIATQLALVTVSPLDATEAGRNLRVGAATIAAGCVGLLVGILA